MSRTRNLGYESDTLGYYYTSVATNTWKCAKMLKCARPVAGQFLSRSAVLERDVAIQVARPSVLLTQVGLLSQNE